MLTRHYYEKALDEGFDINAIVALLGPRQCGKTTLAQMYAKKHLEVHHFDLENIRDHTALSNPMLALEDLEGLIVIDEIQLRPELFPALRVLVDKKKNQQFLILGSASKELLQQSSQTLAGRITFVEMSPLGLYEVPDQLDSMWLTGGYPKAYLAKSSEAAFLWIEDYIATFLERDIPNLGISIAARTMRRFWSMLAHYHGNIFNASELGKSLGVAHTTARHYLDILTGTFMVRELMPWHENINKRQIKSPKIYFRDSGIYHHLMGIESQASLRRHPKLGASWEGMALEQIIRAYHVRPDKAYFWGVHNQAELDLLLLHKGKRLGFEFKYSDSPTFTTSMRQSLELLELDKLTVVTPKARPSYLSQDVQVIDLVSALDEVR